MGFKQLEEKKKILGERRERKFATEQANEYESATQKEVVVKVIYMQRATGWGPGLGVPIMDSSPCVAGWL